MNREIRETRETREKNTDAKWRGFQNLTTEVNPEYTEGIQENYLRAFFSIQVQFRLADAFAFLCIRIYFACFAYFAVFISPSLYFSVYSASFSVVKAHFVFFSSTFFRVFRVSCLPVFHGAQSIFSKTPI